MNNLVKKTAVVTLALIMVFSEISFPIIPNIKAESNYCNQGNSEEKEYVIVSKGVDIDNNMKKLDDDYNEKISYGHHIYTIEASKKELEDIESKYNVQVSENYVVSACGKISKKYKNFNNNRKNNDIEWNKRTINSKGELLKEKIDDIDIAIIDSGIDYSPDINVVDSIDLVDKDNDCNIFTDITGHGTSIAGIIASTGETEAIEGINSNVNIYSARILDEYNNAPISRVVDAIYWAIEKK